MYSRSFIIFIFTFLTSIQLDGMLKNGIRMIFRSPKVKSSGIHKLLVGGAGVGAGVMGIAAFRNDVSESQQEAYPDPVSFWSDFFTINMKPTPHKTSLLFNQLSNSSQSFPDEQVRIIKMRISKDPTFAKWLYERICNKIDTPGNEDTLDPKFLAILLTADFSSSKSSPNLPPMQEPQIVSCCALLKATILKNVTRLSNQELRLAIAACYQFLNAQKKSLDHEICKLSLVQNHRNEQMVKSFIDQESDKQCPDWVAERVIAERRTFAKQNSKDVENQLTLKIIERIKLILYIKKFDEWVVELQLAK